MYNDNYQYIVEYYYLIYYLVIIDFDELLVVGQIVKWIKNEDKNENVIMIV
jgi:hypothetical protein